jgi:LmbE family N-acetylglucosaminyl deacetylase
MGAATIVGAGTLEATWSPWLAAQAWQPLDTSIARGRRIVVLAAHPDDEILGVAGLMVTLAGLGHEIVVVWATDGEASHPGSTAMSAEQLRDVRRSESLHALAALGVAPAATHHLGFPDGSLGGAHEDLRVALARLVTPDDLVIAPWCEDGHPDHDAVGEAARMLGATAWHYPIWMWHWAAPGDGRFPWDRVRVSPVADVDAKAAAISMFTSQVEPIGPAPEDAAILPPHVVARFVRPYEWIVT